MRGFIEALYSRLNPTVAAEKAQARRREIENMERRHAREQQDQRVLLEQEKQEGLAQLKEAQARQVAEHTARNGWELERHVREREETKRMVAEFDTTDIARKHEEQLKRTAPTGRPRAHADRLTLPATKAEPVPR
jgi:hypothetical protein